MLIMTQRMKEYSDNLGKHHDDDDGIIGGDAKENGMEDDEYFDGFHNNEDVISKAYEAYMGALNKLTGRGDCVSQFLMGEG